MFGAPYCSQIWKLRHMLGLAYTESTDYTSTAITELHKLSRYIDTLTERLHLFLEDQLIMLQ